jgi:hypothetical protein
VETPDAQTAPSAARPGGGPAWAVLALGILLGLVLWARGLPGFVAWEVARDHERCFGLRHLPARVFSDDPAVIRDWLESRGTPVAPLPARAGGVEIAGARYCPLQDRIAAHVYFVGDDAPVSVFVLSGPARIGDGWEGRSRGFYVRLVRSAGRVLAVVGERERDVAAVARALTTSLACLPIADGALRASG